MSYARDGELREELMGGMLEHEREALELEELEDDDDPEEEDDWLANESE